MTENKRGGSPKYTFDDLIYDIFMELKKNKKFRRTI